MPATDWTKAQQVLVSQMRAGKYNYLLFKVGNREYHASIKKYGSSGFIACIKSNDGLAHPFNEKEEFPKLAQARAFILKHVAALYGVTEPVRPTSPTTAVSILPASQLNSISTDTLIALAQRALYEARRRTGSDEEYTARDTAYKATQAALLCNRGEVKAVR